MIAAGELDVAGAGDRLGQVAALLDRDHPVVVAVDDQAGDVDRRQDRADVHLPVEVHQRDRP